jgi:hypothetical protein
MVPVFGKRAPRSGVRRQRGRLLVPVAHTGGYVHVHLWRDNDFEFFKVHRLVAVAFLPATETRLDVNHKDGVVTNNAVENLEWATRSANLIHKVHILGKKANWPERPVRGTHIAT